MGYGGIEGHEVAWLFHVSEGELLTTHILKWRSHSEQSDTGITLSLTPQPRMTRVIPCP